MIYNVLMGMANPTHSLTHSSGTYKLRNSHFSTFRRKYRCTISYKYSTSNWIPVLEQFQIVLLWFR